MPQWKWWNLRWACPQEGNSLPSPPGQVGQVSIYSLSAPSPSFPALLVTLVPASLARGQDAQLYQREHWRDSGGGICSSLALVCSTEHSAEMGTPRGQIQRHQSCRYLPRDPQSNTYWRQARLVPGTWPSHADFQQGPQLGPSPGVARPSLPEGSLPASFSSTASPSTPLTFPGALGFSSGWASSTWFPSWVLCLGPIRCGFPICSSYSLWIYIPLHLLVTP